MKTLIDVKNKESHTLTKLMIVTVKSEIFFWNLIKKKYVFINEIISTLVKYCPFSPFFYQKFAHFMDIKKQ